MAAINKLWPNLLLVLALAALSLGPLSAASPQPSAPEVPDKEVAPKMSSCCDAPPRKVIVGTMMRGFWEDYPGLDSRLAVLSGLIDRMAEQARDKYGARLDLAVLNEAAVTGETYKDLPNHAFPLEGKVLEVMGAAARKHDTYVIVPLYLTEDADKGIYTNAAVLLDRTGAPVGAYRKVYPVADSNDETLEGGVQAGTHFPVFDCDFGRIGIQICYDISFDPGWEVLGRKGAEIIAWPSQSPQTIQPRAYARRHDYHIVSATWTNNASIFDPLGDIIAQTTEPSSVLVHQIDLTYALIGWQPKLDSGRIFTEKYGPAVGFRYSQSDDGGIFWSNDPDIPIMKMVRDLGIELLPDALSRARVVQDRVRGGPPSLD